MPFLMVEIFTHALNALSARSKGYLWLASVF